MKSIAKPVLMEEISYLQIPQENPLFFRVYGGLLGAQVCITADITGLLPILTIFIDTLSISYIYL
jgi:hypothetical protein